MIVIKTMMITITIYLILLNNYKYKKDDKTNIVNIILIMYIIAILFG